MTTKAMGGCRACGGTALASVLDLGRMPLAGGFLPGPEAIDDEERYPLEVHVCEDCALVQIVDPVDPDVLFQDYSFSSSTVVPLVDHFRDYAAWLKARFAPERVIEFGCNDGVLLAPLGELGVAALGVDPSRNITELARDRGLDARTGFFDVPMATALREEVGPVQVVTGSNAFAHNADPTTILEAAKAVLEPGGHLCLEVMYAGDLLDQVQWDTLYHEHLTFYSLGTLDRLLKRNGFGMVHAERIPMHGGSIRVVAQLSDSVPSPSSGMEGIVAQEEQASLNNPRTWTEFGQVVDRKIQIVRDVFAGLSEHSRVWAYGAAGKATMWVNACSMDYLESVVDASPLRAGKLMPGTHTPIVFPERLRDDPPDHLFVTAWNYLDRIREVEPWFEGIWSVPLPDLRFL